MPPKKRSQTYVDLTTDEGHKTKKSKSNEENEKHKADQENREENCKQVFARQRFCSRSNKATIPKGSHNYVSAKVKTEKESWQEGTICISRNSDNQVNESTDVSSKDKHAFSKSADETSSKKQPKSKVNVRPRKKVQQNLCVDSENTMPKLMKHTPLSEEQVTKSKDHTDMPILLPERSPNRNMLIVLNETSLAESKLVATSSFSNHMITNEASRTVDNKPCARVKPKLKKESGQQIYINAKQFSSRNCILPYIGPESTEVLKRQFDQSCKVCYSIHVRNGSLSACPLAQPIRSVSNNPGSLQGHAAPLDVYISCSRVYESRLSLFAHRDIPERTQFGPLEGRTVEGDELATIKLRDIDTRHYWPISTESELEDGRFSDVTISAYLDTSVEECSNWLRFLVPEHVSALEALPDSPLKANIQRVTRENEIYFVTLRDIEAGEELFLAPMEPPERAFFNLPSLYYSSGHGSQTLSRYMHNCQYCATRLCDEFPFSSTLHMIRHHNMWHKYVPGSLRIAHIWQCYLCGLECLDTNQLEKHYERWHPTARRLQCPYCGVTRNNGKQMTSHFTVEHAKASEYQCAECNLSFEHYYDVRLHRDQVHSSSDDRTCEHCGQQFKSLTSKRNHIKFVHEKARVHVCEECGQQFKDKYQLKVHSQRHSGLKPYQCQDCSKSLSTKQALIRHYASRHGRAEVPPVSRVASTPPVRQRRMVKTIYIEQAHNNQQPARRNQPSQDKARNTIKPKAKSSKTQRPSNKAEKNKSDRPSSNRNENADSTFDRYESVDSGVKTSAIDNNDLCANDTINSINRPCDSLQSDLNEHRTRGVKSTGGNGSNISEPLQKNTCGNKQSKARSLSDEQKKVCHANTFMSSAKWQHARSKMINAVPQTLTKQVTPTATANFDSARAHSSREATFESSTGATKGGSSSASALHKHFKCIDCPLLYFTKQALEKHVRTVHDEVRRVPLSTAASLVVTTPTSSSGTRNAPRHIKHSAANVNIVSAETDAFSKKTHETGLAEAENENMPLINQNISLHTNNLIRGINNDQSKLKHDVISARLGMPLSPSLTRVELNKSSHSACSGNTLENSGNYENSSLSREKNSAHLIQNASWVKAHSSRKSMHGENIHNDGENIAQNTWLEQVGQSAAVSIAESESNGFDYDVEHDESEDVINYKEFEQGLSKRPNSDFTAKHYTVTSANKLINRNHVLQKLREKINSRKDENSISTSNKVSLNLENKDHDPILKNMKPEDKTKMEVKISQKPKEQIVIDLSGAQPFDSTEEDSEDESQVTDVGLYKNSDDITQTVETLKTETFQHVPMLSGNSEDLTKLQNYQIINQPTFSVPIVQNSVLVPLQHLNTGIAPAISQSAQVPQVPMYYTGTTFTSSTPTVNYFVNEQGFIIPVNMPPQVNANMQNTLQQNTAPVYNGASSNMFFIPKEERTTPTPAIETAMQQPTLPMPYNPMHPQADMPNALLFSNAAGEIVYVQANDDENNEPQDLSISPKKAEVAATETMQTELVTQPVRNPTEIERALHHNDREPLNFSMRSSSLSSVPFVESRIRTHVNGSRDNMTQQSNVCDTKQKVSKNPSPPLMTSPSRESSVIMSPSVKSPASILTSSVIASPEQMTSHVSTESGVSAPRDESLIPMESIASITRITSFIPITTITPLPTEPLFKSVNSSISSPHGNGEYSPFRLSKTFHKQRQEKTVTEFGPLKNGGVHGNLNPNIRSGKCDARDSISVQMKDESVDYTQLKPFTSKVSESHLTAKTVDNKSKHIVGTSSTEEAIEQSSDNIPKHVLAQSLTEDEIKMILNRLDNSDSLSMNNDIMCVNYSASDKAPNLLSPSKHTFKTRGSHKQPSSDTSASSISDSNVLNNFEPQAIEPSNASEMTDVLRKQPIQLISREHEPSAIETESHSEASPESQNSADLDSRHSTRSNIDTDSQNEVIDCENETDPPERIASIWNALNKLSTLKAATPARNTEHDDFLKAFEQESQHMAIQNIYVDSSFEVGDSIAEEHEREITDSDYREEVCENKAHEINSTLDASVSGADKLIQNSTDKTSDSNFDKEHVTLTFASRSPKGEPKEKVHKDTITAEKVRPSTSKPVPKLKGKHRTTKSSNQIIAELVKPASKRVAVTNQSKNQTNTNVVDSQKQGKKRVYRNKTSSNVSTNKANTSGVKEPTRRKATSSKVRKPRNIKRAKLIGVATAGVKKEKTSSVDALVDDVMPGSSDWTTNEDAALASFISGGFM